MTTADKSLDPIGDNALELERMNRLYAMLSHINRTIVRVENAPSLYAAACRIAVDHGGFSAAWLCLQEPDSQHLLPVAAAGLASVAALAGHAAEASDQCPTRRAAREARPIVLNGTDGGPLCAPCRSFMANFGLRAVCAFPIRLEGDIVGVFNVASNEAGFFRDAEVNLLVEVAEDLSFALDVIHREEKRLAAETKMRYLAYYDSETGMPSRALFEERLTTACQEAGGRSVAVLVVNLRHFPEIVQLLGPGAGLEIIRVTAARLDKIQPPLSAARIAEAKFALMLREPAGLDTVEELAWNIHRMLAEAIRAEGQKVFLDPFVGIAVFPRDGSPVDVLKHAMMAATSSVSETSDHCRFFIADMDDHSRSRLSLDAALRQALERNEFLLHYQPQVDLTTGRIVGAEALLRWERPGHGLVPPCDFIPLLEENRLIGAVGEWVLHEACQRCREWQDAGLPPLRVAVNLSARQFHDGDIRRKILRALDATRLEPRWLELELTEGIVLLDADSVIRTMHDLRADGVSHTLDDFGTGYSSLSYLQRLPVARIKIDRSFVTHITSNPSDAAIARAVVGMAHSLGLTVIAEGVETEGQLGYLRGIGCEEIQGYFFSHPLPEHEFVALLREGRCIPSMPSAQTERTLLMVDDEPGIIAALTRVLRSQGYRIISTTSAREGFNLLASHHPGVVICDQRMPEMTGTEFLRRAKDLYPDTMRIVLSGYTELNSVIEAVNQGAIYKFITKPWDDDALCESIKDAFNIHELRRENQELSRRLSACQMITGMETGRIFRH